jgi:hypothetical protein
MDNMTVIEFPEHPRLKRAKAILALVETRLKQTQFMQKEIDDLMMEYNILMLQIAPVELARLAAHFHVPQQLEFNF